MDWLINALIRFRAGRNKLLREALETLRLQRMVVENSQRTVHNWQLLALRSQQEMRDLAIAFRVAQEQPEVDLREDLDALVRELSDQVALLEEQIVSSS